MSEQTMPRIGAQNYRQFRREARPFWLNRIRVILDAVATARVGSLSTEAAETRNRLARTEAICIAIDSIYDLRITPGAEMWEALQAAVEIEMDGVNAVLGPLLQPYTSLDFELEEG
jgi:hypothetical protein